MIVHSSSQRYWFTDGLAEMGVGLGFVAMGIILLNFHHLPTLPLKIMALPTAGMLMSWAFPNVITAVRQRWLNQTAVTAIYRSSLRDQLIGIAILLPIVIWISLNIATLANNFTAASSWQLWCITIGLFFSLIPLALGLISGVLRFYILAVPIILAGLAAAQVTDSVGSSALLVWFVTGLSFLVSGTVALARFQRHNGR